MERLAIGDWIKGNIIGVGIYEIESISDFHINFKCLKIFGTIKHRGHVTNVHYGTDDAGERIKIDHDKWFKLKIERQNENSQINTING